MSKKNKNKSNERYTNSLSGLVDSVAPITSYHSEMLSQPFSFALSNSYAPISLNRILISYAYMTHGVLQTLVDQPVDDGFREMSIKSDQLSDEEKEELRHVMEIEGDLQACKDGIRWARLFGGGGVIINTDQQPNTPLSKKGIHNGPLAFIAADRWELCMSGITTNIDDERNPVPYNYYDVPVHRSRVIKLMGKKAPSFVAQRLQGWGLSCFECTVRDINSFVKNQSVIYELLDEAKIDVYKITGYNTALASSQGEEAMKKRIALSTMLKNFQNALAMDMVDDYQQKQVSFSGLSEMLKENRIGIASSVKMPMTKLFGLSASGFNAGEDDIENYNSLVESQVREQARTLIKEVATLRALQMFGFEPDLEIEFEPLRILNSEQEENVKTQKFNRINTMYDRGLLTPVEYFEALRQEKLFFMSTKVGEGINEPIPPQKPFSESSDPLSKEDIFR